MKKAGIYAAALAVECAAAFALVNGASYRECAAVLSAAAFLLLLKRRSE